MFAIYSRDEIWALPSARWSWTNSASSASAGLELELLEEPPRLAHRLGRGLGARQQLDRGVLAQLGEPVEVDAAADSAPDRDDDEVAVPRVELLEAEQDLLALGSPHRAAGSLLLLARRSGRAPRSPACARSFASAARSAAMRQQRSAAASAARSRVAVDGARDLEQRLSPPRRLRVEQPLDAVEPPAGDARERRRLLLRELRRAPAISARTRAPPAAGTGRAGSASGSSPDSGPSSSATSTTTAYGGGSSRSLSSASAASSFSECAPKMR